MKELKDKTYISVAFLLQPFLTCSVAITLSGKKHKIAFQTLGVRNRMRIVLYCIDNLFKHGKITKYVKRIKTT